jgi:hypothetical protein
VISASTVFFALDSVVETVVNEAGGGLGELITLVLTVPVVVTVDVYVASASASMGVGPPTVRVQVPVSPPESLQPQLVS